MQRGTACCILLQVAEAGSSVLVCVSFLNRLPLQLLLGPLPQLVGQSIILGILSALATRRASHGIIQRARLDVAPGRRRSPQLVQHAVLDGRKEPPDEQQGRPHPPRTLGHVVRQVGIDHTGVDSRHVPRGMLARHDPRVQGVGELALAVAIPRAHVALRSLERVKPDTALGGHGDGCRGQKHYADISIKLGGSLVQDRGQQLSEQGVADMVGTELQLVAIGSEGLGGRHASSIEHEDIETAGVEGAGGGLDRVQRGQVQGEGFDVGVGDPLLDVGDGILGLLGGAGGQPDLLRVVAGQVEDGLFSQSRVAARHEDDFALERGNVFGCEGDGGSTKGPHLGDGTSIAVA